MSAAVNHTIIDINPQFQCALELMEGTKKNVFVTGRAGTGKSTLLQHFRDHTKKKIAVLAPTGVAAVNVRGQTIHSFFGFKPDITLQKVRGIRPRKPEVYRNLDAIVVDEISMVRADLLDCMDAFLRAHGREKRVPFGGIQMIMVGDLYQLPPVVTGAEKRMFSDRYATPYFFSARAFAPEQKLIHDQNEFTLEMIELEKIYRQRDGEFIALLNAIRNNSITDDQVARLNDRHLPGHERDPRDFSIVLTTTNDLAREMNERELGKVRGKPLVYTGEMSGKFDAKALPTDVDLHLKVGAQVMLLNNDTEHRWINGTMGKIVGVKADEEIGDRLLVQLQTGGTVEVVRHRWDMYEYSYSGGVFDAQSVGSFTQYPLKLAWAVTIHKSQGKTFDRVILDVGRGTFSPGQMYVALSRCTSFEGLILKKPMEKKHIWTDWRVVKFLTSFQYKTAAAAMPITDKVRLIEDAIRRKQTLAITYLKASDVKSRRTILPRAVGEMEYESKPFLGVDAYCCMRKEDRVFRVDRILEMAIAPAAD